MNSEQHQNSFPRESSRRKRRKNRHFRTSKLKEKHLQYQQSNYSSSSLNNNNDYQNSGVSSDVLIVQQEGLISPVRAYDTITPNSEQTGEVISNNSAINNHVNTFMNSTTFSSPTNFDQNALNNDLNLNESVEEVNYTSFQPINLEQNQEVQPEDTLNQLTISNLLNNVCSEPGINLSNISSKFFQAIITELLPLTDSLPERRSFIYTILSSLVDLGMRCAYKEVNQENLLAHHADGDVNHENVSQVCENNNGGNYYFKNLLSLINIDFRLQLLLKERTGLYESMYRSRQDHNEHINSDNSIVRNSINKTKLEIAVISASLSSIKNNILAHNRPNPNDTPHVNNLINQEIVTECDILKNSFDDKLRNENSSEKPLDDAVINKSFGSIECTEIQCFCISEKILIAGYKNGSILIYCLETGKLLDNIQPHKSPVTSIIVVENILISVSLDGFLRKYDLKKHTVKKLDLHYGIFSSCYYKNILYLGTNSGQIIRVKVSEMRQFSVPLCVSQETVLSIQVTEERNVLLMFILCKGSSVCIRDGRTGSLLQVFQKFQNASTIILLEKPLRLCAGFDDKMLIQEVYNKNKLVVKEPHCVTCLLLYKGVIFMASKVNKIIIYDEDTVSELYVMLDVPNSIRVMAVWSDYLIIASEKDFKCLKIPKPVLEIFKR